jgi:hypothetical protein
MELKQESGEEEAVDTDIVIGGAVQGACRIMDHSKLSLFFLFISVLFMLTACV